MEIKTENLKVWENDPVLYILKEKLGLSGLRITLGLTAIYALVFFGLGWIADRSYTGGGIRFLDPEFSYFTLVLVLIFIPLSFGLYIWQPNSITTVLQNFEKSDVIQAVSTEGSKRIKSYSDFLVEFKKAIDRKIWALVDVLLTIVAMVFEAVVVLPSIFSALGRSAFWYDVKWFMVVSSLVFAVWLYAAGMIFFRQIQAIAYFNRFFEWFNIRVHPMHPDEAGGLGVLGDFTLKASSILVGLGLVLAILSIHQWSIGSNPLTRPDFVVLWVVYLIGTPISLILPMLSAHKAMQQVKNGILNEISQEFEKTLSESNVTEINDTKTIKDANERLQEIQTRYRIISENYPTWPVPARLFRNFSITASLPLVSGLISTVINFRT